MNTVDKLYERVVLREQNDIDDISTIDTGYFSKGEGDSVSEFATWFSKFMTRFGIGSKISRRYWGDKKRRELQNVLYDSIAKKDDGRVALDVKPVSVYDKMSQDVRSKNHTKSDFQRVARTETANLKAVYQLMTWQQAGVNKVEHLNNPTSVARKTVSPQCKALNHRVFEIDYLLSKQGEKDRICIHPNCQCRYRIVLEGMK